MTMISIMASEIKVDTIVNAGGDNDTGIDLATNDQILLKVANATKLTMNSTGQTTIVGEGGTTTTSLQQGLVKFWCQADSSASVRDSLNNSGSTDNGTGDYSYTFTNNMGNDDYALGTVVVAAELSGASTLTTSSIRISVFSRADSFSQQDQVNYNTVAGDLA
jgi:hypothetical protein